jgi:hypothetical protein
VDTHTLDSKCLTLTEICRMTYGRVSRPDRARLAYAIECLGLQPARIVGTVRLWHPDDVARIRGAVSKIACRSRGDAK